MINRKLHAMITYTNSTVEVRLQLWSSAKLPVMVGYSYTDQFFGLYYTPQTGINKVGEQQCKVEVE